MEREQEAFMKNLLKETRTMVVLGMMLAITIVLDMTPLGAIPMGTVVATIAHLPTILVGILLGPIAGALMGFMFGVVSLLHALIRPASPFSLLFINPLISILPRILIGVGSYYAYVGVKKLFGNMKMNPIAIIVGTICGSLTNTVFVLTMLVIVYGGRVEGLLAEWGMESAAIAWAIGVAGTNGIIEAIVSAVILTPIAIAYFSMTKSKN